MKKWLGIILSFTLLLGLLSACEEVETVPQKKHVPTMQPMSGNTISFNHVIGDVELKTTYDLGSYRLEDWRITDSKAVDFKVEVQKEKKDEEILIEHVHADVSIKARSAQLNGLTQDSMDNQYHGTSQDGFLINEKYPYKNIFAVEGFSKDIISGWSFYMGDYGQGSIDQERLTERNLYEEGAYGSELMIVYNVLIKEPGDTKYHVETFQDDLIIPTAYSITAVNKKSSE